MIDKTTYQSTPVGWCWQEHVDINLDIYETEPLVLMAEQFNVVEKAISLLTDNPDDELITSVETEECLEYYYNNNLFLSLDTMGVEHDCRITFQYKLYRIPLESDLPEDESVEILAKASLKAYSRPPEDNYKDSDWEFK